jgi:hypothetical protein
MFHTAQRSRLLPGLSTTILYHGTLCAAEHSCRATGSAQIHGGEGLSEHRAALHRANLVSGESVSMLHYSAGRVKIRSGLACTGCIEPLR